MIKKFNPSQKSPSQVLSKRKNSFFPIFLFFSFFPLGHQTQAQTQTQAQNQHLTQTQNQNQNQNQAQTQTQTQTQQNSSLLEKAKAFFSPIELVSYNPETIDGKKIELGRKLFFDFRLSKDGSTACVRCHWPMYYGADRLNQSMGFNNNKGARNAQTILNLKYQKIVHWRNDRVSLEEQAERAFTTPLSLGNENENEALQRLKFAGYESEFKQAFPQDKKSLSIKNAAVALADYQRSLTTPSPFDKFLHGDKNALTKKQQDGLETFINTGCIACHNGAAVGGNSLQKFGVFKDYWSFSKAEVRDTGRGDITKEDSDRYVFKVPSLRNVQMTAPYFHDGSARDLKTAISWMAELQLNKKLSKKEIENIEAFLESLTGVLPVHFQQAPILSPSPQYTK